MALNLAALTSYVDQLSQPIISKAVLESNTAKYIDVFQGVKYSDAINILDINPYAIQANNVANQGFNDSGTTTMTQINVVACPLKIQNSFVLEGTGGLEQIWYGMLMKKGSYQESAPQFEEAFMNQLAKYTSQAVDVTLWMGSYNPLVSILGTGWTTATTPTLGAHSADTAGNTGVFLPGCQGLLYNILNVTGATNSGATIVTYSGAPTSANIYGIIESIVGALPSNMLGLENISIWCQPSYVDMYKRALIANNNFHYFVQGSEATSNLNITIPGRSNITLRGTIGLAGSAAGSTGGNGYQGFICTNDDNLVMATDNMNDYEGTKIWFSNDYDQLRATTKFKVGGQIKFPSQIVVY